MTLFTEHEKTKGLGKHSINMLAETLVKFIEKKYTIETSSPLITKVCEHAVKLFQYIKSSPSNIGGIVSFRFVQLFTFLIII